MRSYESLLEMGDSESDSPSDALVMVSIAFPAPLAIHRSYVLRISGPCSVSVNIKDA